MMSTHKYDPSDVNGSELLSEIFAALTGKEPSIITEKDEISIVFGEQLDAGEITTLDTVVSDHKAALSTRDLARNKELKKAEVDKKTRTLIAAGFTYASKVFSMSTNAQNKWNALHADRANHTYPVVILTADESDEESLADAAAVEAFYTAMVTEIRGHIDSGATLKKSARDAGNQGLLDAVVDGR
jgi:hypothetical protein